jgi:hypothetical protein
VDRVAVASGLDRHTVEIASQEVQKTVSKYKQNLSVDQASTCPVEFALETKSNTQACVSTFAASILNCRECGNDDQDKFVPTPASGDVVCVCCGLVVISHKAHDGQVSHEGSFETFSCS